MLTKEEKSEIIKKFGGSESNSGSPEVQVALLTARINYLTPHFNAHKLDHHSMTGMKKIIGQRRSLLKYIKAKSPEKYTQLISDLGLRK